MKKKLTKLNSLPSWETLENAAPIRKFEPIVKILEETKPDILPGIWYHRKWRSIFAMNKDLQFNEKEKQAADSEGISSHLTPKRSIRSPTNELFFPKKCLLSSKKKFIRGTMTREKLILCTELHADQTLNMESQLKTDEGTIAACSDKLVAKEAYYHWTYY